MSRRFAYVRVSTSGQTVENQIQEIKRAGFDITPRRIVADSVSGSSSIEQRPNFVKLLDRLEPEDILVVTKMDRLGRSAMDVASTVARLTAIGVRVHCLQLGGADLTSSAGKMIMGMLNTFAEFERDLLIERTLSGRARARAAGKKFGRKPALDEQQRAEARRRLSAGATVAEVAKSFATSRQTILRARDAA